MFAPIESQPSTGATKALPRRRNGKEQACEPCRKAKMRCDHTLPLCQNCRRRGITEKCIYVEAPQTRPKSQRASGSNPKILNPSQVAAYAHSARLNITSPEYPTPKEEEDEGEASIFRRSSGFYGPTSFSAVFQDNESDLGPKVKSPQDQSPAQIPDEIDRTMEEMSAKTALGIKVLSQLPNQTTCDRLLELYASKGMDKGFHQPTVIYCMSSFWTTFGPVLRSPRKSKDLRDIAQLLTRNTVSMLRDTDDPEVWLAQLSGRNLRWEMMGILVCTLGNVLLALPDDDPFWQSQSGRRSQRRHFALEMKMSCDDCVELSNQMDNINVLMVSLLFKRNILESQVTGDTSLMLWRAHGDLNNATTGLGLHKDRDGDAAPTISSEMRRRTWAVAFAIDKTIAAFTGRPPGLSHRFNMCPLPLDLADDVLLAPKEERDRAISKLDVNGWNQTGEFHAATSIRAVMAHSLILSEILEISLGSDSQYSHQRLIDLKTRNDQDFRAFPLWLHLAKEAAESNAVQWHRISLRLRYLHCCLLLEQLSIKKVQSDQQHLIDVAREMLELTVCMWVERDRFMDRLYDYDWMIMCYGIPASGIICVELLRQAKQPKTTHLRMPRSEVIQNLSMLVGFLEWVRPTAANRELCGRMSVIIKRILDQVLDPPSLSQQSQGQSQSVQNGLMTPVGVSSGAEMVPLAQAMQFDIGAGGVGDMEMVDFDWLGTVDWTQGPFVDLGNEGFNHFPVDRERGPDGYGDGAGYTG